MNYLLVFERILSRIYLYRFIIGTSPIFHNYERIGGPTPNVKRGRNYYVQRYSGEHKNEYTLINEQEICHYKNGLLKNAWKLENGEAIGDYESLDNGCAKYFENYRRITKNMQIHIKNSRSGCIKEIIDMDTRIVIYRGDLDTDCRRLGRGFEFDSKSGELKLEGIWVRDQLIRIIRIFNGKQMTEFNDTRDNLDVVSRIPSYCGEYYYDEDTNSCYRDGTGYILNDNGIAVSRGVWTKGVEERTTILTNGWYIIKEDCLRIDPDTESIEISVSKYENESYLDLNKYKKAVTIDIKDNNFSNTDHFNLNGMKALTSLRIGNYCFHIEDRTNRMNRTFDIVDCSKLQSIIIGTHSFLYYSGGFGLSRLPSLELIQIGNKEEDSYSFSYSNFILKGELL